MAKYGLGTIIYLAALAGVDPQRHEAAMIDGATRMKRIWHINLPSILPTMVILLILNVGSFMSVGFEKYSCANPLNLESSDVISIRIPKRACSRPVQLLGAIGLFNSVINFILRTVNRIAKRVNETSLW